MSHQLLLRGGTIVTESGEERADLAIDEGRVSAILPRDTGNAAEIVDVSGKYILPGVIDPHVHYGLGNGLDDWRTETRSSALGGVTSAFSFLMAGTSYLPLIDEVVEHAARESHIDYGLHLVAGTQLHLEESAEYAKRGITSYKYFTSFRGDEGAYLQIPGTDDGFLYEYLEAVSQYDVGLACVHAENIEVVWKLRDRLQAAGRDDLLAWSESRPPCVEAEAALRAIIYARQFNVRLYLVHISSAMAVDEVRAQRTRFPDQVVYAETCPHFLTHHQGMALGSLGKVNPPLRTQADIEALWSALADGTISTVGSDHVARRRAAKTGNIWTSSAGFPGSGAILPVLLSEGVARRRLTLPRVVALTSANPARALGIFPMKGSLEVGADADVTVVDLDLERKVDALNTFQSHSDYSLYDGMTMRGWPILTMVRGRKVMEQGQLVGPPGYGKYISRAADIRS